MVRALKFSGLVVVNLLIAVIGTAILDTWLRRAMPPHSIAALFWKECILSIVCAALIGFGMWRTWRSSAAKWTWVPAAAWFAVGLLAFAGRDGFFGRISVSSATTYFGAGEARIFFSFTVPLIRAISYSASAQISSLFYPAPVVSGGKSAVGTDNCP